MYISTDLKYLLVFHTTKLIMNLLIKEDKIWCSSFSSRISLYAHFTFFFSWKKKYLWSWNSYYVENQVIESFYFLNVKVRSYLDKSNMILKNKLLDFYLQTLGKTTKQANFKFVRGTIIGWLQSKEGRVFWK